MKAVCVLIGTVVIAGITACVPFFVQKQPSVVFEIHGDDGQPLSGATLHFARTPLCFGCVNRPSELSDMLAGSDGRVAIQRLREVQWVIPAPDSVLVTYEWAWCIDREGFEPAIQNSFGPSQVKSVANVTLRPSAVARRCVWGENHEFISSVL